jgi:hypothetical protein
VSLLLPVQLRHYFLSHRELKVDAANVFGAPAFKHFGRAMKLASEHFEGINIGDGTLPSSHHCIKVTGTLGPNGFEPESLLGHAIDVGVENERCMI